MQKGNMHRVHKYHVISWNAAPEFIHSQWYRRPQTYHLTLIPGPVRDRVLTRILTKYPARATEPVINVLMQQTRRMKHDD